MLSKLFLQGKKKKVYKIHVSLCACVHSQKAQTARDLLEKQKCNGWSLSGRNIGFSVWSLHLCPAKD